MKEEDKIITKETDEFVIEELLNEQKKAFKSTQEATKIIEEKVWKIFAFLSLALLITLGGLLQKNPFFLTRLSLILSISILISLSFIYKSIKTLKYHSDGTDLDEVKRQDSYYFDKNGIKLYEIESYAIKTKENRDRNNKKGSYLNKAILSTLTGSIIVVLLKICICLSFR